MAQSDRHSRSSYLNPLAVLSIPIILVMTFSCLTSLFKYGLPLTKINLNSIHQSAIFNKQPVPIRQTMDLGHALVAYVTTPNEDVARNLAKQLIENRLAACVNIVKTIESIYEWKGVVEQDQESMLIIKTHSKKSDDLIKFVEKNHPYDCPEVITVKVDSGSKKYLDWIHETISKSNGDGQDLPQS